MLVPHDDSDLTPSGFPPSGERAAREPAAREPAAREPVYLQAPDYTHWTVHEVHDPVTPGGHSLLFVSSAGFRRVRNYPPHWRTLSTAELWALSWQR